MKSKNKLALICMMAVLSMLLVLSGCGQNEASNGDKALEMSWVGAYMEAHSTYDDTFKVWIEDVKEKSDGKLNIVYFAPNTLCPEKDVYDSTVSGAVDIGGVFEGWTPGKFYVTEMINMPMIAPNSEAASQIFWQLYQKYPEIQKQYQDVKILWTWTSATNQIHTTKKPVRTLEDLKGLKIIAWDPQSIEAIKMLGANPIEVSPLDTYLALERGMADGVICPMAPLRSYKISDVAKYHAIVDLSVTPFCNVMNLDRWNGLSSDLQQLLDQTTGIEMSRQCGISLDRGAAQDAKWMVENGHTIYEVPAQEKERWVAAVKPMHDKWVKNMEAKGVTNAREMLDTAMALGQEYAAAAK